MYMENLKAEQKIEVRRERERREYLYLFTLLFIFLASKIINITKVLSYIFSPPVVYAQDVSSQQKRAFEIFRMKRGKEWEAEWDEKIGNPDWIRGSKYINEVRNGIGKSLKDGKIKKTFITQIFPRSITGLKKVDTPICSENNKLCIKDVSVRPDIFSPNYDNFLDEVSFTIYVAFKHTDSVRGQERKNVKGDSKYFYLDYLILIYDESDILIDTVHFLKEVSTFS